MRYFVAVSYDVTDDKRRYRVHRLLKNFGTWVQYSVFECILTEAQLSMMEKIIRKVIKPRKDRIRFYFLCSSCQHRIKTIGGKVTKDDTPYIV